MGLLRAGRLSAALSLPRSFMANCASAGRAWWTISMLSSLTSPASDELVEPLDDEDEDDEWRWRLTTHTPAETSDRAGLSRLGSVLGKLLASDRVVLACDLRVPPGSDDDDDDEGGVVVLASDLADSLSPSLESAAALLVSPGDLGRAMWDNVWEASATASPARDHTALSVSVCAFPNAEVRCEFWSGAGAGTGAGAGAGTGVRAAAAALESMAVYWSSEKLSQSAKLPCCGPKSLSPMHTACRRGMKA